MLQFHLNLPE